jgi:hypothetical protein
MYLSNKFPAQNSPSRGQIFLKMTQLQPLKLSEPHFDKNSLHLEMLTYSLRLLFLHAVICGRKGNTKSHPVIWMFTLCYSYMRFM